MAESTDTGLLLVNLGTPAAPEPAALRHYLREFLLDGRVLDVPAWRRWMIVNFLIVPFRSRRSAEAYRTIWTEAGSPLLAHSLELARKVRSRLGETARVAVGMRYGEPSIRAAMADLRRDGVDRIVVMPLYPQYSAAATASSLACVMTEAARSWTVPNLQIVPPFFDHERFVHAVAEIARPVIERVDPERVFLSFHGVPERQIRRSDPTGTHCLRRENCCARLTAANRGCYRAQCFATAKLVADRLGIDEDRRVVCFQSRLGRTPWIRPYTDEVLAEKARRGVKRAVILSPAFVADCLETIEELGLRGAELWRAHGGETLALVPSLNAEDVWADAVVEIASTHASWLRHTDDRRSGAHAPSPDHA